jgi:hypothetical protein
MAILMRRGACEARHCSCIGLARMTILLSFIAACSVAYSLANSIAIVCAVCRVPKFRELERGAPARLRFP